MLPLGLASLPLASRVLSPLLTLSFFEISYFVIHFKIIFGRDRCSLPILIHIPHCSGGTPLPPGIPFNLPRLLLLLPSLVHSIASVLGRSPAVAPTDDHPFSFAKGDLLLATRLQSSKALVASTCRAWHLTLFFNRNPLYPSLLLFSPPLA